MTNHNELTGIESADNTRMVSLFLRLGFLGLSVVVLIQIVDFKLVITHISSISLATLSLLVAIALFRTWLTGVRWQMLNHDESGQLSGWRYFCLVMMAKPFNMIMPGALGGDFVRTALTLKTVKTNRADNLVAILVDRFVGLFSIAMLGAIAFLMISDLPDARPFYYCFTSLAIGFVTFFLFGSNLLVLRHMENLCYYLGKVGRRLVHILEAWRDATVYFRRNPHRLVVALLLCLPIHGFSFLTSYIISKALGMQISFFEISAALALVWVITAVPITVSGAGIRELSMIFFLSQFGVGAELATALSVYLYIVNCIIGAVGLLFIALFKRN